MIFTHPGRKDAPTGCFDENGTELHVGQTVEIIFGGQHDTVWFAGEVTFEAGAYGIAFNVQIDWNAIEAACGKKFHACFNDNFISFWELQWNLDAMDTPIPGIKII